MADTENGTTPVDEGADKFPSFDAVLAAIEADPILETNLVERLEVWANGSGDASVRVWAPRAVEPEIGFYSREMLEDLHS